MDSIYRWLNESIYVQVLKRTTVQNMIFTIVEHIEEL